MLAVRQGCLFLKLQHSVVGLPDRLLVRPDGTVAFVELKRAKGGRIEPIQAYWLAELRKMFFTAKVIRSTDDFRALLTP